MIMAAIGAGLAPDAYRRTPAARKGFEGIRRYLRDHPPANAHHRAMELLASSALGGLMTEAKERQAIDELLALQRPDGGWNLASLGRNWRRDDGTPQDYDTSDGYGTGFVIHALRTAGVPADHPRIRSGIRWLKSHQRASGRWFTRSLRRDTSHLVTHAGTAYAILALVACGETVPEDAP